MQQLRALSRCHNIADLRILARRRLPRPLFDYLDGGAEDEAALDRNGRAFDRVELVPRALVDVAAISTGTRLLGCPVSWPLICSPTGASRFYHPTGEAAVARAAAAAGILYGLSTMATTSLEDVAAAAPEGARMFQLYVFKDRGITRELVQRCKAAGYQALCLTVDAAVRGKRERELRSGLGVPMRLSPQSLIHFALRPRWALGQMRHGPLAMPNFAARTGTMNIMENTRYIGTQLDASVTWADAEALAAEWGRPFAIKGILSPLDARRAVDAGATALFLSNHGGRQLDGAVAPFTMVSQVREATGADVEIIVDGGIRRGSHIVKALAAGASACAIGRPYLFGLAAGGEAGVTHALSLLRTEFVNNMQLCGARTLAEIGPDLLRPAIPG